MLLQVEGIDVNYGVSVVLNKKKCHIEPTMSPPLSTTTNPCHYLCVMSVPFFLQNNYGTPLRAASENGHAGIVTMLLQVKGIDVNIRHRDDWVSIMLSNHSTSLFLLLLLDH